VRLSYEYGVLYRPIANQWLCKQQLLIGNACNIHARDKRTMGLCNLFLSNGSGNTFPRKRTGATIEEQCFRCGQHRELISKTVKLTSSFNWSEVVGWWVRVQLKVGSWVEFNKGGCEEWRYSELTIDKSLIVGYSPDSNDMSTESGESPLLEAVARKATAG
jgi:hypothetical protein